MISETLTNLRNYVDSAYDQIQEKGGTIPVKKTVKGISSAIQSIPSGASSGIQFVKGVTSTQREFDVIFVSEGVEVARYSMDEFISVTSLPEVPQVDGCVPAGWNWNLNQIKNHIQNGLPTCDLVVGAQYRSIDGTTRIYISIPYGCRKKFQLYLKSSVSGGLTIDWGDGTTTTSTTTTTTTYTHEYSSTGEYIIRLVNNSGTLTLGGLGSAYNMFGNRTNSASNPNGAYQACVDRIVIGNGVLSTAYSFQYCYLIKSIIIPPTIELIGYGSFQYMIAMEYITIPNSVTEISDYVFQLCYNIRNISLPPTITKIGSYSFQGCSCLENITFPQSLISVNSGTLQDCFSMIEQCLDKHVTTSYEVQTAQDALVHKNVVANVDNIVIKSGITSLPVMDRMRTNAIQIPTSVTTIPNYAFANCRRLYSLTIPDSVKSIGSYAFQNCSSLKQVDLSKSSSFTSLSQNMFNWCSSLHYIDLPDNIKIIGTSCFQNCKGLHNIRFSSSITNINNNAFQYCDGLRTIVIPKSATFVGSSVCYQCQSLTYVKWDSPSSISQGTFQSCYGIKTYDFSDATSVITLMAANAIQVGDDTQIVVPDSLYESWRNATNWSTSTIQSHIVKASEVNLS